MCPYMFFFTAPNCSSCSVPGEAKYIPNKHHILIQKVQLSTVCTCQHRPEVSAGKTNETRGQVRIRGLNTSNTVCWKCVPVIRVNSHHSPSCVSTSNLSQIIIPRFHREHWFPALDMRIKMFIGKINKRWFVLWSIRSWSLSLWACVPFYPHKPLKGFTGQFKSLNRGERRRRRRRRRRSDRSTVSNSRKCSLKFNTEKAKC